MKLEIEIPDELAFPENIARVRTGYMKLLKERPRAGRPPMTLEQKALNERVKAIRKYYETLKGMLDRETYGRKYFAQELELVIAAQHKDEATISRFEREQPWTK